MKAGKSPLDKVLGRLDDLDEVNLGILVQRLARERKLLETVFDVIRDGILVLDGKGDINYANIQGKKLIGLKENQATQVSLLPMRSRNYFMKLTDIQPLRMKSKCSWTSSMPTKTERSLWKNSRLP